MDGVLVDTEHLWDEVREELTGEWGGRYTPEAQQAMMGMSSHEWSRYLHEVVGLREPPDVINAEVVRRMLARYEVELPVVPGAVDAVRRARGGRLPARARVVVEPRADRHGPATAGLTALFERHGVVRGGRAGKAGPRRLPRGRATPRRRPGPLRRGRGLRERDPRGARGGDARDRLPEPALSAASAGSAQRRRCGALDGGGRIRGHGSATRFEGGRAA